MPGLQVQKSQDIQAILDRLGISTQLPFELIPAVLPTISFERPAPSEESLCWGRQSVAAVAAQNSHFGLFNPISSGRLIHVDSAIATASAASVVQIGIEDAVFTTIGANFSFRDRRVDGSPSGQISGQTNAGGLVTVRSISAVPGANEVVLIPFDAYIEPGQGVAMQLVAVNVLLDAAFFWEELELVEK